MNREMQMSDNNETTGLQVRQLATLFERSNVKITHTMLDPGQEIPWHLHNKVTDVFYVVRGPLTIMTKAPEGKVTLNPGDTYRTDVLQPHRVVNEGSATAEFFLIQGIGTYDFKLA